MECNLGINAFGNGVNLRSTVGNEENILENKDRKFPVSTRYVLSHVNLSNKKIDTAPVIDIGNNNYPYLRHQCCQFKC